MLKVLLVDDDAVVNNSLKKLVSWEEIGAVVIGEARNGQSALEQIAQNRPDLIITDIRMPVMDGLELCKRVSQATVGVSMILLSAYEDFSYAKAAMHYGVKDYIIKPIDRPKLNQLIDKISGLSQRLEQRSRFYAGFTETDVESRLFEAVVAGNEAGLHDFFDRQFDGLQLDGGLVREMSFKYMSVLFQILKKLELKPDACGICKSSVIDQLFAGTSIGALKSLVFGYYQTLTRYVCSSKNTRAIHVVDEIEAYLRAQFTDPDLTVASTADRFHVSANYLSILFRQVKRQNVSAFIGRLRIERARELLRDTEHTVASVSRESGYLDEHYFAKVFKKAEGMTPSAFRNLAHSAARNGDAQ